MLCNDTNAFLPRNKDTLYHKHIWELAAMGTNSRF